MRKALFTCAVIASLALASCSTISTRSGAGVLYTGVSEGEMVTSNPLGTKVGTAGSIGVLGLVSVGDASIQTAAKTPASRRLAM